jgi:hypothetical protein
MMRNIVGTTLQRLTCLGAMTVSLAVVGLLAGDSVGASINYGNFGPIPPGVSFLGVEESSGTDAVPLYGPPTPFPVGLDFNPASFVASSAGGGADITDGQLNFTVRSPFGIASLGLLERGDYTLAGVGTPTTQVTAGAIFLASVTEINGAAVAPINLAPVNGSVGFNLAANPGVVQPWSLGLSLDVAGQLGPGQYATKVKVVVNNQLLAISEPSSVAFIAKKDFTITVTPGDRKPPEGEIPEPASVVLVLCCASLVLVARRHRRGERG